jgi:hypothetical protein
MIVIRFSLLAIDAKVEHDHINHQFWAEVYRAEVVGSEFTSSSYVGWTVSMFTAACGAR